MDLRISGFLMVVGLLVLDFSWVAYGNLAFPVVHKFKGTKRNLSEMIAHDGHRHGRFLAAADFQLGGNGLPSAAGFVSKFHGLANTSIFFLPQSPTVLFSFFSNIIYYLQQLTTSCFYFINPRLTYKLSCISCFPGT